jgi:hypothetical protein
MLALVALGLRGASRPGWVDGALVARLLGLWSRFAARVDLDGADLTN